LLFAAEITQIGNPDHEIFKVYLLKVNFNSPPLIMAYINQFEFDFPNLFTAKILNSLASTFVIQMTNNTLPPSHSNVSKIFISFYFAKGVKKRTFELK
jgi:hypothetical protein